MLDLTLKKLAEYHKVEKKYVEIVMHDYIIDLLNVENVIQKIYVKRKN